MNEHVDARMLLRDETYNDLIDALNATAHINDDVDLKFTNNGVMNSGFDTIHACAFSTILESKKMIEYTISLDRYVRINLKDMRRVMKRETGKRVSITLSGNSILFNDVFVTVSDVPEHDMIEKCAIETINETLKHHVNQSISVNCRRMLYAIRQCIKISDIIILCSNGHDLVVGCDEKETKFATYVDGTCISDKKVLSYGMFRSNYLINIFSSFRERDAIITFETGKPLSIAANLSFGTSTWLVAPRVEDNANTNDHARELFRIASNSARMLKRASIF